MEGHHDAVDVSNTYKVKGSFNCSVIKGTEARHGEGQCTDIIMDHLPGATTMAIMDIKQVHPEEDLAAVVEAEPVVASVDAEDKTKMVHLPREMPAMKPRSLIPHLPPGRTKRTNFIASCVTCSLQPTALCFHVCCVCSRLSPVTRLNTTQHNLINTSSRFGHQEYWDGSHTTLSLHYSKKPLS